MTGARPDPVARPDARLRSIPTWVAPVVDAACVLVFAAVGRASHHEASPVLDAVATAWPFLAGVAAGWVLVWAVRRTPPVRPSTSWPVWVCAVVIGMTLRHLTGRGVAASFVVVAAVFLGITLLGWRVVAALVGRRGRA